MLQVLFENFMLKKQDNKTANSANQQIDLGEGLSSAASKTRRKKESLQ
jgi:hypothetical protein